MPSTKFQDYVDEVFSEPSRFFRRVKIKRGRVFPVLDKKAVMYYFGTGVGTAYTVDFGVNEELEKIRKTAFEVVLQNGRNSGEIMICIRQGDLETEFGPFEAKRLRKANLTPLLYRAARYGHVLPLSLSDEIREKIKNWLEENQ